MGSNLVVTVHHKLGRNSLDKDNQQAYQYRADVWEEKSKNTSKKINAWSEENVANSENAGIIDFKDNNSLYLPVTKESIDNVPKLNVFNNEELDLKYQNANKGLLQKAKDCPVGTEVSIVYDEKMNPIKNCNYIVGKIGSVKIDNPKIPYHAFHNHASGETFSVEDLLGIAKRDNMLSLTTVGNNSKVYCIKRTQSCDCIKYNEFLRNKIFDKSFFKNNSYYDFKSGSVDLSKYSSEKLKELKITLIEFGKRCAENGRKFGFEYIIY